MAESQLRKGALELAVLCQLTSRPTYGGALLHQLSTNHLDVSPGTLYPLLARLKKAGHITSHWEESPAGPPRKVYTVTDAGRAHGRRLATEWHSLSTIIDTYLKESEL